jgi:hypothetical protein
VEEAALEPLDSTGWEPYAESEWDGVLEALREKDLLLYCGLMDARPFRDEKEDKKRLILDMPYRYCYEVLKLERHRTALKIFLAPRCAGCEIILRHGALWTSCESREASQKRFSDSRAADSRVTDSRAEEPDFFGPSFEEPAQGPEKPRPGGVPFDGLVREVTRWLRGDVILVRRGEESDDDAVPELPIEE